MALISFPFYLFLFSIAYELSLLGISAKSKNYSLLKTHITLFNMSAGIAVIALLFLPAIPLFFKLSIVGWKALLIFISRKYWKNIKYNRAFILIPSILGTCIFQRISFFYPGINTINAWVTILILCVISFVVLNWLNLRHSKNG